MENKKLKNPMLNELDEDMLGNVSAGTRDGRDARRQSGAQ